MGTQQFSYLGSRAFKSIAPMTSTSHQMRRRVSKGGEMTEDCGWYQLPSPSINTVESANSVYELPSTKEMVRFLHAALGYPTKATMLTAAKQGNLVTFPGLTPKNISRHFPESDETQKGHMKQTKQGVRSTKVVDKDAMLGFKPNAQV
jgi:hypothetical protein